MATQKAARSFSLDLEDRIADLLDSGSDRMRERVHALELVASQVAGRRQAHFSEMNALRATRDELIVQRDHELNRAARSGVPARRELPADAAGNVEIVADSVIARLDAKIAKIKTRMTEISDEKLPPDLLPGLHEEIRLLLSGFEFVDATLPTVPKPSKGEDLPRVLMRVVADHNALLAKRKRTELAPRTRAETVARAKAEIAGLAKQGRIKWAALARGGSEDVQGNFRVANPNARLGFARQDVGQVVGGAFVQVRDAVPLVAWLFESELVARLEKEITAGIDENKVISERDKPGILATIESQLWESARLVEESYLACIAAGFANVRRMPETKPEVLLGVERFNSRLAF